MEKLLKTGVDKYVLTVITSLYQKRTAAVRVDQEIIQQTPIKRGVRKVVFCRQYCAEKIFQNTLYKKDGGISVNGVIVSNILCDDDCSLLARGN